MPGESGNKASSLDKLHKWVSVATAAVGAVVALAGLAIGRLEVLGWIALIALPWAAAFALRSWPYLTYVFAIVLSGILITLAILAPWGQKTPEAGKPAQPQPAHTPQLKFQRFDEPQPHCVHFQGTGVIPAVDDLVLFDRPSDPYGGYTGTPVFYDDGPVDPRSNGWTADRDIGSGNASDKGTTIAVVALLVPKITEQFLNDETRGGTGSYDQVPPSVMSLGVQEDKIVITRNGDNRNCGT